MTDISFLSAAEWLPDALLLVTPDGIVRGANRAARSMLKETSNDGHARESLLRALHGDSSLLLGYLKAGARARQPLPGAIHLKHGAEQSRRLRATSSITGTCNGE